MITKNQVFTRLTEYSDKLSNVYATQYYEQVPQSLPCLYFRETHSPISRFKDLNCEDEQYKMFVYVELYGNNLESLCTEVEKAMKSMKFYEDNCQNLPNTTPSIERISMRFQRVITESSTL